VRSYKASWNPVTLVLPKYPVRSPLSKCAYSSEREPQPRSVPPWLQLSESHVATSIDSFGKREAEASVVVTNNAAQDAHVYLRFRLYNDDGFQVAVCSNGPRPIFSDNNLLVPARLAARLGCAASPFEGVAEVPSKVRVELLGWEQRR
jgi:hypothetical protein